MQAETDPLPRPPSEASIVIIGGGIAGCSLAYHLSLLGWKDVILLERRKLTCGTTWHAAGLIAQLRSTLNMTKLAKYSANLYSRLEEETGINPGFKRNGSVAIALTNDRMHEFRRNIASAELFNIEVAELNKSDCLDKYPFLEEAGIIGGIWTPLDGQADPVNITLGLAHGARQRGVKIFENVQVTGFRLKGRSILGVQTNLGFIRSTKIANCAGMWARQIGKLAGVRVPVQAAEHSYFVTEPVESLPKHLPVLRVPDEFTYIKEDAGKLLVGSFEPLAKPYGESGIPEDFCFDELPFDMDHMSPIIDLAINRVPILSSVGIQSFFNGPEAFTPDNRYLLGEAVEANNFFIAAGFNSVGIQSAGGAGKVLSEWIDSGEPPCDLWDVDIRRIQRFQSNKQYLYDRTKESLGLLYADHYPFRQYSTARGLRHSPLHDRFLNLGACFGEHAGWERPNWFCREYSKTKIVPQYDYGWGKQNWFESSAKEHLAVRNNIGIFDLTSLAKFKVEGRDSTEVLNYLCGNEVDVDPGKIIYTQLLNHYGGIEGDITVTRLSENQFLIVTSPESARKDFAWIERHIPEGFNCVITDVTSSEAVISIMGPNSGKLLSRLSKEDWSADTFPFGTFREAELGMAVCRAHRISYVGESGWEIYVSTEMAVYLFDLIFEIAQEFGSFLAGMHALDSCRIENGFRHIGHDITYEDHVLEAGLGFAVKCDKVAGRLGDFIGRASVEKKKETGLSRMLLQFKLIDERVQLFGKEPITLSGKPISFLTSASFSHSTGSAIGMGYVPIDPSENIDSVLEGDMSINVAGVERRAHVSIQPFVRSRTRD